MGKRRKNPVSKASLEGLYKVAEEALQTGQSKRATKTLREIISRNPREGKAHFLLGNLYRQSDKLVQALHCYERAHSNDPDNAAVLLNHANILQRLDRLQEAESDYLEVLEKHPGLAIAHFNFGLLEKRLGKLDSAAIAFRQALSSEPGLEQAYRHLAGVLQKQGQFSEAAGVLKGLLRISPQDVEVLRELGGVYQKFGAYGLAEKAYISAIDLAPGHAETHYDLGISLQQLGDWDQAIKAFRSALERDPDMVPARVSLGNCFHQTGEIDAAAKQYRDALSQNPKLAHARLGACISQLPILYRSEEHIEQCRVGYARALEDMFDYFASSSQEERSHAASAVGFLQPFYLAYQGLPVKALQQRYAATIRMLMTSRFPQFDKRLPMPGIGAKIRLGMVSGFLRNHSAWNYFQGVFEAMDRNRFEITLFHTHAGGDRETQLLKHLSDGFIEGPKSTAQWADVIRSQDLHALFYPEFGMDPMCIQLGCLRLAPIQFTSWGHPVTSGLESIDYYLSSDLMEPENGQDDYTEQLVRLPNLMMHYRLPTVDPEQIDRADLDLPQDAVIFWCCQSLFKYLPRHDDVFPRIAKMLDKACFVFLAGHGGTVEQQVRERLAKAFELEGPDMNRHCVFLPKLPKPTFAAVSALADVFLDSVDWSGCNSTMEAIGANLPVLTLPGSFMRGRHTTAFLKMMGMEEWIAADKDEYVALAVRLGKDDKLRKAVSEKIRIQKNLLYRDPKPVRALEKFLEQAVADYEPKAQAAENNSGVVKRLQQRVDEFPDSSTVHMELALHLQREGEFDAAANAFSRSLELQNPRYASAQPLPAAAPLQPAIFQHGVTELAGLEYPAIRPVEDAKDRPFWSVVIPAFNREHYLLECLASVLAQWQGDSQMEIIVIDNGSEPPLKSRVESIGRGIVRYHRHPETIPLQCNWNSAVNASRGRWVHLLHDDDYVLPGFYDTLQQGLKGAPETVGVAFTAYENIDENNDVIFRNRPLGLNRGVAEGWVERIGVGNMLNPPAIVISRDAYEHIGGYSEQILYTTDWELYMRLASYYDWWYEPAILVHYRQHRMNVTAEQNIAGVQGEAFWRAIEMSEHYLPEGIRRGTVASARRYYFNWALQRLRLPLQAGNTAGALSLLCEMLHIDHSEDSVRELFDWLGTAFAEPVWPAILEAMKKLPADISMPGTGSPGQVFDWLCSARGGDARMELAYILRNQTNK